MPIRYIGTGVGDNVAPPLAWRKPLAAELVPIVEEPDAPVPKPVIHADVAGIPPSRLTSTYERWTVPRL